MRTKNDFHYRFLALVLTLFLLVPVLTACSSSSQSPQDTDGTTEPLTIEPDMFSTGLETTPPDATAANPPAELVQREIKVLESTTQEIDASGGQISLSDGTGVVFPAGALSSATEISIAKLDPSAFFDGTDMQKVVLRCTAPETQFNNEVEIRIALPQEMDSADSSTIFAGILDETSGLVTFHDSAVKTIDTKPVLAIATDHFSDYVEFINYTGQIPDNYELTNIPYYSQGKTLDCWAATFEMICQAAHYIEGSQVSDVVGELGVLEGFGGETNSTGVDALQVARSESLAQLISRRTKLLPDRIAWDNTQWNELCQYIKYEIGVQHQPVGYLSNSWNNGHAAVIVGYNSSSYYFNDPQLGQNPYMPKNAGDFQKVLPAFRQPAVTVVIPTKNLDSKRPAITVNINNYAFDFTKSADDGNFKAPYYRYVWDNNAPEGWRINETANTDQAGTPIFNVPGNVKVLHIGGSTGDGNAIRIANSSSELMKGQIQIDIAGAGPGKTSYSLSKEFSANACQIIEPFIMGFVEIPVDAFRDNNTLPTLYNLKVSALVGGSVVDQATVPFSLDTEVPKIDSISVDPGPAGTVIIIAGSGFGTVQGSASEKTAVAGLISARYRGIESQVIIDQVPMTNIKSWNDNKIEVSVPDGSSGNVLVKRGTVESNPKSFDTQTTVNTITGSKALSFDVSHYASTSVPDIHGEVTIAWQVSGKGLVQNGTITPASPGSDNSFIKINGKLNVPIHLHFTAKGTLSETASRLELSYGDYCLETFHAKLSPRQLEWGVVGTKDAGTVNPTITSDTSLTYDFTCTASPMLGDAAVVWLELDVVRVTQKYDKDGNLIATLSDEYHESPIQFTFSLK